MFLHKAVTAGMILFFPLASDADPAPEVLNEAVFNAAVKVMQYCYKTKHTKGTGFVRCMAREFIQEEANPYNYRIFVSGDVPGSFILTISNASGYVLKCEATAQQRIAANHCSANQGAPIKPMKSISITPTPSP